MPAFPELRLPDANLGPTSLPRRLDAIREAIAWQKGRTGDLVYTPVWESDAYSVKLGKPGKEAAWAPPKKKTNANDMLPTVFHRQQPVDYIPSFKDVWKELETASKDANALTVDLLACLFFRAAYMLDHTEDAPGVWRYAPHERVLAEIVRLTPSVRMTNGDALPIGAFLHLVEALSLNEDVKYYTLGEAEALGHGEERIKSGIGRRNNLTTCAHVIGVILGRKSFVEFGGSMASRRGVAPMTPTDATRVFPLLGGR